MQLQSSQNQQSTLKLVSPSTSPDDKKPRTLNSDNPMSLPNASTQANEGQAKSLNEANDENAITITGINTP